MLYTTGPKFTKTKYGKNEGLPESSMNSKGTMGGSPGELSEELVTQEKRKKGCRMNCDVGEETEGLENEL